MTNEVNTSCRITNHAGKSVLVLDAFNSSTNVANNAPKKGYQQELKILDLVEGGQVIEDGATGTVTLNDTRTDSQGKTQPNYLYQLLISEPQSLFPVMNVGEALDFMSTPMKYPPIEVTAVAAKNMKLALTFCQNIMAYPSSNLSKDFQQAMTDAQKQPTVDKMMQTISNYFNSTKGFNGLDFPSYLAVSTYIRAFAWVWGLNGDASPGTTYWLYASSDAGNGQSSGGNSSSSQGSLTFKPKSTTSDLSNPTDPNSSYDIYFTSSSGNATKLVFDNGQFVDDASVDVPSICLQGTYGLKSLFTRKDSDNVLWSVLVGTLHGTKVIGVRQSPDESSWLKSILPKNFDDLVSMFLKIMGVWMAIDFLKNKLEGKKDKLADDKTNENRGQDPSNQQQQNADNDADEVGNASLDDERSVAERMGEGAIDVPDEAELSQYLDQLNQDCVDVLNEITGDNYDEMISEYESQLRQLAEIEVNPDIEDAMSKLVEAKGNMESARETGDYSEVKTNLSDVKVSIGEAVQNMDIPEELQEQLAESQQAIDDYQETADEMENESESVETGDETFDPEIEV